MRFRIIDSLLSAGGVYSIDEIVDKLEVEMGFHISKEQFNKDLRFLREVWHPPIPYKRGSGYFLAKISYPEITFITMVKRSVYTPPIFSTLQESVIEIKQFESQKKFYPCCKIEEMFSAD